MHNGRAGIFAEKAPHPRDAFAAHDVVGIDHVLDARECRQRGRRRRSLIAATADARDGTSRAPCRSWE